MPIFQPKYYYHTTDSVTVLLSVIMHFKKYMPST